MFRPTCRTYLVIEEDVDAAADTCQFRDCRNCVLRNTDSSNELMNRKYMEQVFTQFMQIGVPDYDENI